MDPSRSRPGPPAPGRLPLVRLRAVASLVLTLTLLVGSAWDHARAGRPPDGPRPAPDLGVAAGGLDCPQSACAMIVPGGGDAEPVRVGGDHRRAWPTSGRASVRLEYRLERPPRPV